MIMMGSCCNWKTDLFQKQVLESSNLSEPTIFYCYLFINSNT